MKYLKYFLVLIIVSICASQDSCYVRYCFIDKNNISILEYSSIDDIIHTYLRLKENDIKKYGDPTEYKDNFWLNSCKKKSFNSIGNGHLIYYAVWEMDNKIIFLLLTGKNNIIELYREYYVRKNENF